MPAHAEIADIVEKDDASRRTLVDRLAQEGTNDRIMPSRLANDSPPQMIVIASKNFQPLGHRTISKIGKSISNDTRRLTACVRIDRVDFHYVGHSASKYSTKKSKPQMDTDEHR